MSNSEQNTDQNQDKQVVYPGLLNLGNTCFINAIVQCLLYSTPLNKIIDRGLINAHFKTVYEDIPNINILHEWISLRNQLQNITTTSSNEDVISPLSFINAIKKIAVCANSDIQDNGQHDVSELMDLLIEHFHKSICRPIVCETISHNKSYNGGEWVNDIARDAVALIFSKEYSELWPIFNGVQLSNRRKMDSHTIITTASHYNMLSIPIVEQKEQDTPISLVDCLTQYFAPETISGVQSDINPDNKVDCLNQVFLWNLPEIIIICLQHGDTTCSQRNETVVSCTAKLNMLPYLYRQSPESVPYTYELYAMCNHYGRMNFGHYTARIKLPNGIWLHCNDEKIHVKQFPDVGIDNYNIVNPYCLFYRPIKS
jgi:ubiquitin carboxyl-terminal hydrolase 8